MLYPVVRHVRISRIVLFLGKNLIVFTFLPKFYRFLTFLLLVAMHPFLCLFPFIRFMSDDKRRYQMLQLFLVPLLSWIHPWIHPRVWPLLLTHNYVNPFRYLNLQSVLDFLHFSLPRTPFLFLLIPFFSIFHVFLL